LKSETSTGIDYRSGRQSLEAGHTRKWSKSEFHHNREGDAQRNLLIQMPPWIGISNRELFCENARNPLKIALFRCDECW